MPDIPSLRVDFYSAAGVKLDVPPLLGSDIFAHSYTLALNRIGNFSLTVAADSEAAAQATMGRQLWVYRNNEGLLFKGVVEDIETTVAADGSTRLVITGRSTAALLTWKTTLLGRTFDNVTLSSLVSTLLSSSGFTAGSIDSPSTNITTRFDGRNLWDALVFAGEVFGLNVREDNLSTEIDIGAFGTSSGITLRNLDELSPALANNPYMVPITSIRKRAFALDIANKVIPIGQQSGIAGSSVWFTLAQSTRSSPYTIGSATGPDGQTYYYIEDTDSQTAYGTRERVLQVRDILPLGVATADFQRAANTLYDEAVTYLQRHKDAQTAYDVDVVGLSHISGAAYRFQVGDTMRLQFNGVTQDADGRRTYLSVDTDLYVMELTRSFDASGADTWRLTLSSVTREMPNDGNITAKFLSELHAVKAAPLPFILLGANAGRIDPTGIMFQRMTAQYPPDMVAAQYGSAPPTGNEDMDVIEDGIINILDLAAMATTVPPRSASLIWAEEFNTAGTAIPGDYYEDEAASLADPETQSYVAGMTAKTPNGQMTDWTHAMLGSVADFGHGAYVRTHASKTSAGANRADLTLAGALRLPTTAMSQITSNQNNYEVGIAYRSNVTISSDAARDITGIVAPSTSIYATKNGSLLFIQNTGSYPITLKDESASSTAANRFALSADMTLGPDQCCLLQYNPTSSRWRAIAGPGGSGMMKVQNDGYEVYPAAAAGIDIGVSGVAWTNSAWSEVVASTGSAVYVIGALMRASLDTATELEMDIGTGGAGAEAVKTTIPVQSALTQVVMLPAPIAVATATRIAIRQRTNNGDDGIYNVKLIYVEQANLVSL